MNACCDWHACLVTCSTELFVLMFSKRMWQGLILFKKFSHLWFDKCCPKISVYGSNFSKLGEGAFIGSMVYWVRFFYWTRNQLSVWGLCEPLMGHCAPTYSKKIRLALFWLDLNWESLPFSLPSLSMSGTKEDSGEKTRIFNVILDGI